MPNFFQSSSVDVATELQIQSEITKLNISRIHFITILSLLYFSFIFIMNFYSHFISKVDSTSFALYSIPYSLAFFVNLLILYLIRNRNKSLLEKNKKKLVTIYFWSMLSISLVISILDLHFYNHIIVFLAYLLICSAVLILPLKKTLFPIALSILLLFFSLLIKSNWQFSGQFNILLLIFLALIVISLSYYNYNTIHLNFLQQNLLIREQQKSNVLAEKLRLIAQTDELTKLANRHGYYHYIEQLEQQLPLRMTTLMIDIDSFKKYNDYYGHTFGDIVLSKVAACLEDICKDERRFSVRWGGEEFLLLLEDHTDEEIVKVYHEFINKMALHNIEHEASGISNTITFSIGGNTLVASKLEDIQNSIHFADEAQYIVKHSTKNRFLLMTDGKLRESNIQY